VSVGQVATWYSETMTIEDWIKAFVRSWTNHDVDAILDLFAPDVEYWETPYVKLGSFEQLTGEWQGIRKQSDINVSTELFASLDNNHTVKWTLQYKNNHGESQSWAGIYLIRLNTEGACTYFHQVSEQQITPS
jgi:hypothetical protein